MWTLLEYIRCERCFKAWFHVQFIKCNALQFLCNNCRLSITLEGRAIIAQKLQRVACNTLKFHGSSFLVASSWHHRRHARHARHSREDVTRMLRGNCSQPTQLNRKSPTQVSITLLTPHQYYLTKL